jgi:ribosome-binding protein aMBF1 (putative translation factor)
LNFFFNNFLGCIINGPIKTDYPSLEKDIRRQLAISQEDLARELGVGYATVNRWENGQVKPSKLARSQLDAFCAKMLEQGMIELSQKTK